MEARPLVLELSHRARREQDDAYGDFKRNSQTFDGPPRHRSVGCLGRAKGPRQPTTSGSKARRRNRRP